MSLSRFEHFLRSARRLQCFFSRAVMDALLLLLLLLVLLLLLTWLLVLRS